MKTGKKLKSQWNTKSINKTSARRLKKRKRKERKHKLVTGMEQGYHYRPCRNPNAKMEHYQHLHTQKFDNLEELDQFIKKTTNDIKLPE